MIYYFIIALIILADQGIKHLMVSYLTLDYTVPLIDGILNLTLIHNYGAAFSILQNRQIILIPITLIVSAVILWLMTKNIKSGHWTMLLSFALIFSGGIGNLIDRIRLGYVVDYLEIKFFRFPVFNIADMAVVIGSIVLVIYIMFIELKTKSEKSENYDG